MIYLRWATSAAFYVPFWLLAMVIAPALPVFAVDSLWWSDNRTRLRVAPVLPVWLNWFMTQDNGLDGDDAWKCMEPGHWEFRKKLASWPLVQTYLGYIGWLWRNPAYGLAVRLGIGSEREGFMREFKAIGCYWRIGYLDGGIKGMFLLSIRRET